MDLISPSQKGLRCPQTPKKSPHDLVLPCDPRSPSTARKFKTTLFRRLLRSSEFKEDVEIHSSLKLRSRKSIAGLFDALSPKSRQGKDIIERPKTTSPRKTKSDPSYLSPTRQMQRRKSLSSILGSVRVPLRKRQMAQDRHEAPVDDGGSVSSHAAVTSIPADEKHITFAGQLLGVVADFKESQSLESERSCSPCTWNSSAPTLAPQAVSGNRPDNRPATPDSYLQHLIDSHALAHSPVVAKSPTQEMSFNEGICYEINVSSPASLEISPHSICKAGLTIEKQSADLTGNNRLQSLRKSRDIAEMIGLTTARMRENFHLGDITHAGLNTSFEEDQGKAWDAIMIGGEILHKASLDTILKSFPSNENLAQLFSMKKRENTPSVKGDTPQNVVPIRLKTYGKLGVPPTGPHCLADIVEVEHCSVPPKCANDAAGIVRINNRVPSRSAHFSVGIIRVEYPSLPKRAAHVETYESRKEAIDAILGYKYCELSEYGIFDPQNRTIYARLPESGQLNPQLLEKHGLEVLWLPVNAHLEDTPRKCSYSSSECRSAMVQEDCRSVRHDEVFFELGSQCSRQTGASSTTLKIDETLRLLETDNKFMCWEDDEEICPALKRAELVQSRFVQLPRKVSEGQDCPNITNGDVKDYCASDQTIAHNIDIETSRTQRERCADRNDISLPRLSTADGREYTLEVPAQSTFTWAAFLEGDVDGLIPYYGHYSTDSSSNSDTSISSCLNGLDTSMVGTSLAQPENSSDSEFISYGASRKSDTPFATILAKAGECASPGASAASPRNMQLRGERPCNISEPDLDYILPNILQKLTAEDCVFWKIKDMRKRHEDWTALLIAESLRCKNVVSSAPEHSDFDMIETAMHQLLSEDDGAPILSPMEATSSVSSIETCAHSFEDNNKEQSRFLVPDFAVLSEDMEDAHRLSSRKPGEVGALMEMLQAHGALGAGVLLLPVEHYPSSKATSVMAMDASPALDMSMIEFDTDASSALGGLLEAV